MEETKTLQAVLKLQTQMEAQASAMTELRTQNQNMENRVQLEIEALHDQNQLLLSKISALSSQNSNAPGIFDGADRRKLEAKQAKQRQSGQDVTRAVQQRQLAFFDMECEFFKNCDTDYLFCFVLRRSDVAGPRQHFFTV